uniref:G-patch domain-containing protein n=1 Tax=Setaria digitata TaxID=48799 RepID=A0A915Q2L8_9BILA
MAKGEEEETKPSSSDAIIASLINEVRKTNEPFDVKSLIGGKLEIVTKKEAESDGSFSSLHGHSKKLKRHKDKKSRKCKKGKYKLRSKSKSPSRKRKKHRSPSRSPDMEEKISHENSAKFVNYTIPPSVEAVMEKISDDEDDLPVGADFLSVNASSSKMDAKGETLFQDVATAAQNKTKEFNVNEERFPLAKKKKKSESPPVLRKPRPLSEILAKVRAERDSTFVPRNIKLRQENGKSVGGSGTDMVSHTVPKSDCGRHDDVEYGPRPLEVLGTQPISDDEDELQLSPLKIKQAEASKSIKITAISKTLFGDVKKGQMGKDGEIPVSDASAGPSFSNDDAVDELVADKHSRSERGVSGNESEARRKAEKKRKKERKDRKQGKRYSKRSSSLSSDSEQEWKHLEKRKKMKEHSRYSGREFDKTRRRPGNLYVQSYYVDSNKRVHEGSKWQWNRGEKDIKEKSNALSIHSRSKGWRQIRSARSPYPDRKRKRSPSSSCSRSHSRSRSLSGTSSRSSHSSHYRKVRSCHRSHNHYHYRRDRESNSKRRSDDESYDHKIDKKKLLEIAQRNAAQMAQLGYLPNAPLETRAQLKAGGQSVDQLVDFCQKLQRSQDKAVRREKGETVSSDDEDLAPRKKKGEDDTDFLKHPFALKPAVPITINIPNSIPLPIKTPTQRTLEESQLRIAYPVSSGAQHREKDNGWTPVKKEEVPSICSPVQKTKLVPIPVHKEKEKIFNTFGITAAESFVLPPPPTPPILASFTQSASSLLNLPPPPPPPDLFSGSCNTSQNEQQKSSLGLNYGNVVTVPEEESVFREPESLHHTPANVGRVMAKRIKASKLLAKDPNDYEARQLLKEADDQAIFSLIQIIKTLVATEDSESSVSELVVGEVLIRAWAESKKNLPGKFTGSTGVNVLKADQLGPHDPRFSVWAKKCGKTLNTEHLSTTFNLNSIIGTSGNYELLLHVFEDFFKQTNAVNSAVGLKLMQKMGWTPGEGLGKGRDGPLEPLVLDIKSDRKGLVATEELPELKKLRPNFGKSMTGKHPVSILMELCSKKRWQAPQFTCLESGPSNNRRFLWKAVVNGVEYQPSVPSTSKKTGKAQACQVVLQSLGLVPRDPSLPVVL